MRHWTERAEARREKLGLKDADIDRLLSGGKNGGGKYREWIKRGVTPSLDNARSLAKALGYTLHELFEGDEVRLNLIIQGISKGDGMWAEIPAKHMRVVPLTLASENLISIEISREDAAPHLGIKEGDIVSGEKVPFAHNLNAREVIAETKDGRHYIGTLYTGTKDRFRIRPLNGKEEIADLTFAWVAPIQFIIRGQ